MISPKGKASYAQHIGENDVGPRTHGESLLQRTQMDACMLRTPASPFEILRNHIEQDCFSERTIWLLWQCNAKIFPDYNFNSTKFFMFINSPSMNLASKMPSLTKKVQKALHIRQICFSCANFGTTLHSENVANERLDYSIGGRRLGE
jgi:hypothetical protein